MCMHMRYLMYIHAHVRKYMYIVVLFVLGVTYLIGYLYMYMYQFTHAWHQLVLGHYLLLPGIVFLDFVPHCLIPRLLWSQSVWTPTC